MLAADSCSEKSSEDDHESAVVSSNRCVRLVGRCKYGRRGIKLARRFPSFNRSRSKSSVLSDDATCNQGLVTSNNKFSQVSTKWTRSFHCCVNVVQSIKIPCSVFQSRPKTIDCGGPSTKAPLESEATEKKAERSAKSLLEEPQSARHSGEIELQIVPADSKDVAVELYNNAGHWWLPYARLASNHSLDIPVFRLLHFARASWRDLSELICTPICLTLWEILYFVLLFCIVCNSVRFVFN